MLLITFHAAQVITKGGLFRTITACTVINWKGGNVTDVLVAVRRVGQADEGQEGRESGVRG